MQTVAVAGWPAAALRQAGVKSSGSNLEANAMRGSPFTHASVSGSDCCASALALRLEPCFFLATGL